MGRFLAGTVFGLVLSVSYVWYDVALPEWVELPDMFQRSLKAAATDDTLFDVNAPSDMRQRALEVYFATQAKRAAAVDASLGHPLLTALVVKRVRDRARVLNAQWSGYDKALAKPALRKVLVAKYGVADDDRLKRHMLLAALRERTFLINWIKRHRSAPDVKTVREIVREVSGLEVPSAQ